MAGAHHDSEDLLTRAPLSRPAVDWVGLGCVGGTTFAYFLGISLLLPVFPLWARALTASYSQLGLATTLTTGLGLIVGRPIAGRVMEGRRRAPTFAVGLVLTAISSAAHPLAADLATLLAMRFVMGVGFGLVGAAGLSAIADLSPPDRRGEIMGYYGALNAVALLVGPAGGMLLARRLGFEATFYVAGGLGALALLPLLRLIEPPKPTPRADDTSGLLATLSIPGMPVLTGAHLMVMTMHGALIAFLPLRLEGHAGWMSTEAFFAVDAVVVIAFRVLVGRRFDELGRRPFILGGLACLAGTGLLLGVGGESDLALAAAAAAYGIGFGAYIPAANALVSDLLPETQRARGLAVFLLAFDLGFTCGGVVLGPLADAYGVATGFLLVAVLPVLGAALHRVGGGS